MKDNPETRLEEFVDEWSVDRASNIFSIESDKGYPELPVLSASQELGMVKRDNIGIDMQYSKQNIASYKRVKPGRFVIHLRSFQGGFAHSAIEGITSPAYTVLSLKEPQKHDDYFWKYLFTSPEFVKRLELVTYGIRDGRSISVDDFFNLPFCYPSTAEEQHKIAQFFSRLDSLINAEDKKLERLKTIKSASLEKMFPKQGETVSEVRFKGFTGEWMESRIGDCFSERKERSGIGEMLSVTINSGVRKARELDRTVHIGDTSNYKVVRQGDIAYNSMRMWQGASGYSQYDGIVSPAYTVIIPNERIDSRFFACLFKTQYMIHVFELNSQGLTSDTWNLKYGQLRSILVRYPVDVKEQIYIAEYFSRLDTLISAQEQKSEKLRSLKKSFLEKMFVSTPK